MSLIILHSSRLPVVRIMRIAGQYAKPRSKPTEVVELETNGLGSTKEKKEVLSFRGDNVNGYLPHDRTPDPERLLGQVLCDLANQLIDPRSAPTSILPLLSTTFVLSSCRALQICTNRWTGRSPMSDLQSYRRHSLA